MRKVYSFVLLALVCFGFSTASRAAITVTPGSGGTNICANLAQTGATPAFTTLGTITVTEGLAGDITAGFHALVINAPAGWRFNTAAVPTFTFTAGRNIAFVGSGGISATALTVNLFTTGATLLDAFTINGLQVQATTTGAAAGNIAASAAPGMTGIVTGAGGTNFGSLSLTPVLTPTATITSSAGASICAGTTVTFTASTTNAGTPSYQWQLNGGNVAGATNVFYVNSTLANGNTVRAVVTATGCVSTTTVNSNIITMTVNPLPTAVTVTGGGNFCTSTTLNASNGGSGTIYYQGTTPMGTSTATPSTSQVITTSGTYYFRARSAAGCWGTQGSATVSINTLPITITPMDFATICEGDSTTFTANATPFPVTLLSQNFNAGFTGWTISNFSGTSASFFQLRNSPGYNSITPGDGTPMMQAAADATGSGVNTQTAVSSPSFSLAGYDAATVSFNQYYQYYNPGDSSAAIQYSIDGGATWATILEQVGTTSGNQTWTAGVPDATLAIPAAAMGQPDVRIRWFYNSTWGWYWAVDNIVISGTPTLTYTWTGIAGASGLSCTSCASPTITPTATGMNVYSVSTTFMGCTSPATGVTIDVTPGPIQFNMTGGGSYCLPIPGLDVGIDGSQVGVDYQLFNGASMVGAPIAGTGSAISFGLQSAAGTYTVLATSLTTGCSRPMTGTSVISINPGSTPYDVAGGGAYCAGDGGLPVTLSGSEVGVVYQLYNGASMSGAPVGGTGSPLDFGAQTLAGTYTVQATVLSTGCISTMNDSAVIIVNPTPAAFTVSGGGTYCVGGAGVDISLSGSEVGVDYQLYTGGTATGSAVAGTGSAISLGLQTVTGTYMVIGTNATTGCADTMTGGATVATTPLPDPITGPTQVCEMATITLANATAGGTWSSSDATVATINATTGVVTGVMAGTATMTYTIPTGCFVTVTDTVNAIPVVAPITGTTSLCPGATTTLSNATAGGTWSSSDAAVATIDGAGVVTAVAGMTATISYTVGGTLGCSASATTVFNVVPYPALSAIGGPIGVCIGGTATMTNTYTGGTWTSSDITVATIDPSTGVVSGVTGGSVTITYTATNTLGCSSTMTRIIDVSAPPVVSPITGAGTVCGGLTITLANATPGGVWASSNTTLATVGSTTGVVTGGAVGVVTISYTVTNSLGCGTTVTTTVNVGPVMPVIGITPAGSATLCHGNPVNLVTSPTTTGITYQWALGGTPIPGATMYYYVATTPGVYTVTIDNGTCTMTLPPKTVLGDPNPAIAYNTTGGYLFTGSFSTYQWFVNGMMITGATGAVHTPTTPGNYTVVVTDGNGCTDTSAMFPYMVSGITEAVNGADIRIYPNPAATTVNIEAAEAVNVIVMSIDGKIVLEGKNTTSIDVADLANGVYLIKVYDNNNQLVKTGKFSKVN
ncbi:MAG: T9SS type A sorting domain-containing protein [Bacteroidota bacterium]